MTIVEKFSGRAIAQAAIRLIPTAVNRIRVRVKSYGIFGVQSGTRGGSMSTSVSIAIHSTDCSTAIIFCQAAIICR
jgi:hypothetical protein